jgi:hypothetical protein
MIGITTGLNAIETSSALAQGVWVGGGVHVRAPFVRVDVGPYGGVSVRAPFTAVDVPPRGDYEPAYPPTYFERRVVEPSFPAPGDLATMSDEQLNEAMRGLAQSLHDRLNRFDTGDTWQRYLRLPSEAVDKSIAPDERIAAIADALERFQKIAADPQYSMIARLPQFVAMQAALNEAMSRPQEGSPATTPPVEDLPLPPQQPQQPRAVRPQQPLPPPEQPTHAERDDPFLKPTPPQ